MDKLYNVKVTNLNKKSHCMVCGKTIKSHDEVIIRIDPYISKPQKLNICFDCVRYLNSMI